MVRLRVFAEEKKYNIEEFQFQYGTIERHTMKHFTSLLIDFNSSMVRLRAS